MKKLWLYLVFVFLCSINVFATQNMSDWSYVVPISINTTVNSSLTDFTLGVNFTTTNSTLWNTTTCSNIRFLDGANNTFLNYEIETCGNSTVQGMFWVKNNLTANVTNTIYAYLGNTNVSSGENKMGAWDSNYKAVWHFASNGTGISTIDSLQKNNLTKSVQLNSTTGYFDGGGNFYPLGVFSSNTYLNGTYNSDFDFSGGNYVMEAWFKSNTFVLAQTIFGKDTYGANYDYSIYMYNRTRFALYTSGTAQNKQFDVSSMSAGSWYHVAYVGTGYSNAVFLNGVQQGASQTMALSNSNTNKYSVGCSSYNNPNSCFNGTLDEIRISKASRSSDWIKAEYSSVITVGNVSSLVVDSLQYGNLFVNASVGGVAVGNSSNFSIPVNLSVNATASFGYVFNNWSVLSGNCTVLNLSSNITNVSVVMNETCVVQANFVGGCVSLSVAGYVLNLTGNVSIAGASCYLISAENVTVDCRGFWLVGDNSSYSSGVYSNKKGTVVRNCNILNFSNGVYFVNGGSGSIFNSSVWTSYLNDWGSNGVGVFFDTNSNFSLLSGSSVSSLNGIGVRVSGSGSSNRVNGVVINSSVIYSKNFYSILFWTNVLNSSVLNSNLSVVNGVDLYVSVNVSGCNFSNNYLNGLGGSYVLSLDSGSGNVFVNNTFLNASDLVYVGGAGSGGNVFCLNNFSSVSGHYVDDLNGSNAYNCSFDGKNQGNIWSNVVDGSVGVFGFVVSSISGFFIGGSGSGVPYNDVSSLGKVVGVVDYVPLTNVNNSCLYGGGVWNLIISDNCTLNTDVVVNDTCRVGGNGGYLVVNASVQCRRLIFEPSAFNRNFLVWLVKRSGVMFSVYK